MSIDFNKQRYDPSQVRVLADADFLSEF